MDKTFNSQGFIESLGEDLVFSFDRASRATTSGLVGSGREHTIRQKLQLILPSKVAIATGCVIDSYGGTSNQTDVILYERDQCPVFSVNDDPNSTYLPCEGVIAVGEVKSTLGTKEIFDAVNKIAKIKSLRRHITDPECYRVYGSSLVIQGAPSQALDMKNKPFDQIYGFILCNEFGLEESTLVHRIKEACSQHEPHLSPNALISLRNGMVMFSQGTQCLENRVGASHLCVMKNPDGEFSFLIHKLATIANIGRTAEKLPYERYVLKSHNTAQAKANFYLL